MSEKRTFILVHDEARRRAIAAVTSAPDGHVVEVKEKTRSLEQNAMLHALCSSISRQRQWMGRWLDTEGWKRLLVDAYLKESTGSGITVVPSLDMQGVVMVGSATRTFGKRAFSELIEFIRAWMAENEVDEDCEKMVRADEAGAGRAERVWPV